MDGRFTFMNKPFIHEFISMHIIIKKSKFSVCNLQGSFTIKYQVTSGVPQSLGLRLGALDTSLLLPTLVVLVPPDTDRSQSPKLSAY